MIALAALLLVACSAEQAPALAPVDLAWSATTGAASDSLDVYARRGGETVQVTHRQGADFAGPVSPQRDAIVVVHVRGPEQAPEQRLWLHPLDGSEPVALSEVAAIVRKPAWSPDGSAVVYESSREGFRDVYRATRDGQITRLSTSPHGCFEPAPLGDGSTVIAPCSGRDVDLFVLSSGGPPSAPLLVRRGEDGAPAASPDEATVAWIAAEGPALAVHTFLREAGVHQRLWAPSEADGRLVPDQGLAWSPQGDRIAAVVLGDAGPRVAVLHPQTGTVEAWVPGDLPVWTPTGGLLVTGKDSQGDGVFLSDPPGSALRRAAPVGSWLGRAL